MSLGIYIHVPFCRRICPYCAFNVVRARRTLPANDLLVAIEREARAHAASFTGPVQTVYFGGGTPSLMTPDWIGEALAQVTAPFARVAKGEVTVEVEPGTMDESALRALRERGVTRLSIGWQSSVPRILRALGRVPTAETATELFYAARRAGFDNISVDWMVAAPSQTDEEFQQDAEAIVALSPDHVSCYVLTLEPKTPFAKRHARGTLCLPGEDAEVRWLTGATRALTRVGLRRYEVASFARPHRQSRHNSAYWSGRPYLGVGPGAHSFSRDKWHTGKRWMGHKSLRRYLAAWQRDADPFSAVDFVETLSASDMAFERVMVGLRCVRGLSLHDKLLVQFPQALHDLASRLLERAWATRTATHLKPTELGLLHADAAALLWPANEHAQQQVAS